MTPGTKLQIIRKLPVTGGMLMRSLPVDDKYHHGLSALVLRATEPTLEDEIAAIDEAATLAKGAIHKKYGS